MLSQQLINLLRHANEDLPCTPTIGTQTRIPEKAGSGPKEMQCQKNPRPPCLRQGDEYIRAYEGVNPRFDDTREFVSGYLLSVLARLR